MKQILSQYLISLQEHKLGIKPRVEEKKPVPLKKQSPKMKKEKRELKKAYAIYLVKAENRLCNIRIDEGCTVEATTVNHTRRRGKNVFNEKDWEPSCANCNNAIENKDAWARANGHLKSKFNNK